MKDIINLIKIKLSENIPFALATVMSTWGTSPRPVGSSMVIDAEANIFGSVSGGCIESEVIRKGLEVLQTGQPIRQDFGVSDADAWNVGLSCGGKVSIWIEKFITFSDSNAWQTLLYALETDKTVLWKTHLQTGAHQIEFPTHKNMEYPAAFVENSYFIRIFKPKANLYLIGAAHITSELVRFAKDFDFKTIVIDPRGIFADKNYFEIPPDELHIAWPEEVLSEKILGNQDYAVILSHDPKIDDPALAIFLNSPIRYIGALGSQKTHQKRVQRLLDLGFSNTQLQHIHAPIGIAIAARSAKEIALSIMAQLIQARNRI